MPAKLKLMMLKPNFDFILRGNYPNFQIIKYFVDQRLEKKASYPGAGYRPAQLEFYDREEKKIKTFDLELPDIYHLKQKDKSRSVKYFENLVSAFNGDQASMEKLRSRRVKLLDQLAVDFKKIKLHENEFVAPSCTNKHYSIYEISHKGLNLLDLVNQGYPVPDFSILTSSWFELTGSSRDKYLKQAIHNLEVLTGEGFGARKNPLVFAIRCAMPQYLPGIMPTYLNVGVTADTLDWLKESYGAKVAGKIYLNNLLTLYSLLYHDKNVPLLKEQQYTASTGEIYKRIHTYYDLIYQKDKLLLTDAYYQTKFFLNNAQDYFEKNKELPYTLMRRKTFPAYILQKMVWTVRNDNSYPGILFSRHSRTGLGNQIESCMNIFGEDIMSGNIETDDTEYFNDEEIKESFPAIYHFSPLMKILESNKKSPVTIEFAVESQSNVHLFALLQLNKSELTGRACLLSAIDMYKKGILNRDHVIKLVQPYHLRQIFSETIDPNSLSELIYFTEGISILPRSAISAKIYFSANKALEAKKKGQKVCYCKDQFNPADTIIMKEVDAILSLNPAAIHVVTACRGYGIPAFLNLENFGVKLEKNRLVNFQNMKINEGDWITVSSKKKTIFIGKAKFTPPRFQKYLDGEVFEMEKKEAAVFKNMSKAYMAYEKIVQSMDYSDISNLDDLTKYVRIDLDHHEDKARVFVNDWFDSNSDYYVTQILQSKLGTHQDQFRIYKLLTDSRRISFFNEVIKLCFRKNLKGFNAGSFMIGRFICIPHTTKFWKAMSLEEICFLLNEYILFEKYIYVLFDVGERNITRAKNTILESGLGEIIINNSNAKIFMTLKLGRNDLDQLTNYTKDTYEAETEQLILLLQKPYGFFYNYEANWSLSNLENICVSEGLKIPEPQEV